MLKNGTKIHHKHLAHVIADNAFASIKKTGYEMLESVGMAKVTAKNQLKRTLGAKGVQKELALIGFTAFQAKSIIGQIVKQPLDRMLVTPENQISAAREIFKVIGEYAPDKLEVRKVIATITFNKPI